MLFDISDYGVYVATRNDTGEIVYVGCSWKGINERLKRHKSALKGNRHINHGLQDFWNAKGLTFTHVVKCLPIKKLALAFEKAYGAQFDFKDLVNVNPLGQETPVCDNNGEKNGMYGKKPWNKGKKCPQLAGENNGMHGLTGEDHPMGGKTAWNKGKKRSKESRSKQSETVKGENHPNTNLTARNVQDIRYMLITMTYYGAVKDIAVLYNVKPAVISKIKNNETWKDVKIGDYKDLF